MTEYETRTALMVVDVQNDFADPKGSLYVGSGETVVASVNREIDAAREAGALIVYSRDWHPSSTPHFAKDGGIWPIHCLAGSWGAAFHPGLMVLGEAPIIDKGSGGEDGYSAFGVRDPTSGETSPTRLESILRERKIERVVVAGLATDYCVKETALDARRLGFAVGLLTKAVRAVDLQRGDGGRALLAMEAAGVRLL